LIRIFGKLRNWCCLLRGQLRNGLLVVVAEHGKQQAANEEDFPHSSIKLLITLTAKLMAPAGFTPTTLQKNKGRMNKAPR